MSNQANLKEKESVTRGQKVPPRELKSPYGAKNKQVVSVGKSVLGHFRGANLSPEKGLGTPCVTLARQPPARPSPKPRKVRAAALLIERPLWGCWPRIFIFY